MICHFNEPAGSIMTGITSLLRECAVMVRWGKVMFALLAADRHLTYDKTDVKEIMWQEF
jgi:hypothetical protein